MGNPEIVLRGGNSKIAADGRKLLNLKDSNEGHQGQIRLESDKNEATMLNAIYEAAKADKENDDNCYCKKS